MSPTSPRQPGFGAGGQRQQAVAATTTPFKIHRDSHLIHKGAVAGASASSPPSSSSTNSSVSSSPGVGQHRPAPRPKQQQQQQQQPVIIYTHSPKVIRTSPRDFMSIVQKLTGLESAAAASAVTGAAQDESSSSSTESCANAHASAVPPPPPLPQYMDPPQLMPPPAQLDHAHFMPDIPLFAPSEHQQHLLCASRGGLYGHFPPTVEAASLGGPANMHDGAASVAVFSPSMVEAMRTAYPDYQLT
ncbi:protein MKS1-like [Hordeum vulgare]|nr:protein MKS1-like [Hordeum vulgare]KAI5017676.1 hypothetical protein ZWY2020_042564 [Hordeum vulgare]